MTSTKVKVQSSWFLRRDGNDDDVGLWSSKVSAFVCRCKWCDCDIKTGTRGFRALGQHAISQKHRGFRGIAQRQEGSIQQSDDGARKRNGMAEVFIQAQNNKNKASTSESDESDIENESSEDEDFFCQKPKKRRKVDSGNGFKKSIRKLQDQLDLFQRNVDIKLNYIESLIQSLIKNQTQRAPPPPMIVTSKPPTLAPTAHQMKPKDQPKGQTSSLRPSLKPEKSREISREKSRVEPYASSKSSRDNSDIPVFPITDVKTLFEWDKKLENPDYRQKVAAVLATKVSFLEPTHKRRVKAVMYFLFDLRVLSCFTFTRRDKYKETFKECTGIIALVRKTINQNVQSADRINEKDLVSSLQDSLKRAQEKLNRRKEGSQGKSRSTRQSSNNLHSIDDDDDDVDNLEQGESSSDGVKSYEDDEDLLEV